MAVLQKAKENPVMTGLITLAALASLFTGAWAGIGLVDRLHTTEAELLVYDLKAHTFASNQFSDLNDQLVEIQLIGKCRWLLSQIRALEDSIYVRTRDDADPDFINELQRDLDSLSDDYDVLLCALKLA